MWLSKDRCGYQNGGIVRPPEDDDSQSCFVLLQTNAKSNPMALSLFLNDLRMLVEIRKVLLVTVIGSGSDSS